MPGKPQRSSIQQMLKPFMASPGKSSFLGLLALVLLILVVKVASGGKGPAAAQASLTPNDAAIRRAIESVSPHHGPISGHNLAQWAREPIEPIGRNLFSVPLDFYPRDGDHSADLSGGIGFWDRLAKSLSEHADQQEQRQILIDNARIRAGSLNLQSTVMGAFPSAMVNGELVREGTVISGFRVLKIQPRAMIVERDGIKLAIAMQ